MAEGLCDLGLRPGDLVVVHASLEAFGRVEGGADAVLDALRDVLGPAGTLILPAHTDVPEYSAGIYDPADEPGFMPAADYPKVLAAMRAIAQARDQSALHRGGAAP